LNGGIARRGRRRQAEGGVRFLKPLERAQRPRRPRELVRIVARFRLQGHSAEDGGGIGPPEHLLKQAELEGCFAGRGAADHCAKSCLGLRITSAGDGRARPDRDDVRIAGVELLRQRVDLVVLAFDERAVGQLERRDQRGRTPGRLRGAERRQREDRERSDEKEKGKATHRVCIIGRNSCVETEA
jgi:hypothetical protein